MILQSFWATLFFASFSSPDNHKFTFSESDIFDLRVCSEYEYMYGANDLSLIFHLSLKMERQTTPTPNPIFVPSQGPWGVIEKHNCLRHSCHGAKNVDRMARPRNTTCSEIYSRFDANIKPLVNECGFLHVLYLFADN